MSPSSHRRGTHRSLTVAALFVGALRAHGGWGVALPPTDTSSPRPAVVYLHGMWASPEDSCGAFEHAATPFGFLVCPRGNTPNGDGRMWTGTYATVAPSVHAALDAAASLAPGKLDRSGGGTLMGYSNGAYFAAEVAQSEPGKWTGLVLLSMHLELDVARLRAAGVRRIVLGAGAAGMWISLGNVNRALIGGLLLGPFVLALGFLHNLTPAAVLMVAIGICGGLFVVPLNALLQARGHETIGAGHALAVQNFAENISMLVFVGMYSVVIAIGIPVAMVSIGFGLILLVLIGVLAAYRLKRP